MDAPAQHLQQDQRKFPPRIQPSLQGSIDRNFGGVPEDF